MEDRIDVIKAAQDIFDIEIEALRKTRDSLGEDFAKLVDLVLHCKGKTVLTGMGKPGHIGTKIAATLASLGTPSFFMHPAEAMHGDLGML
ncbi:MAG: SIS domain-containing protein, partial [Alistipes sp.]|nr:SIS domain-containing protein [Alistipes sp.]